MATSKSVSSKAKPAARPAASKVDSAEKAQKELEAKVASLESALGSLKAELAAHCKQSEVEHKELSAKCDACCEAKPAQGAGLSSDQADLLDRLYGFCRRLGMR